MRTKQFQGSVETVGASSVNCMTHHLPVNYTPTTYQKSTLHTKPSLAVHMPPGQYHTHLKSPHALTQGPPRTPTP